MALPTVSLWLEAATIILANWARVTRPERFISPFSSPVMMPIMRMVCSTICWLGAEAARAGRARGPSSIQQASRAEIVFFIGFLLLSFLSINRGAVRRWG